MSVAVSHVHDLSSNHRPCFGVYHAGIGVAWPVLLLIENEVHDTETWLSSVDMADGR